MPESSLILIVDDSFDSRAILVELLSGAGYRTSEVEDGLAAVEQAAAVCPDLILMDLSLPGLDGLGATRRFLAAGFRGPIVAITANGQVEVEACALAAGCIAVFVKPIAFERLSQFGRSLQRHQDPTIQAGSLERERRAALVSHRPLRARRAPVFTSRRR